MHVVICYPFLDLRFLIEPSPRPWWMFGGFDTVGSFGPVVRSIYKGGEAEIRANAALALGKELQQRLERLPGPGAGQGAEKDGKRRAFRQRRPSNVVLDNGFVVEGRRLFANSDGHVRLEIILRDEGGSQASLADRLESILTTQAYVVREGLGDLIDVGFHVARLYLAQSAKTADPSAEAVATQLLREGAGSPFVVVLHDGPAEGPDQGTPLETAPEMFDSVTCRLMHLAGRSTGVWQIWGSGPEQSWLEPMRILCRIISQLGEVTSLTKLQQEPQALAPHLLDYLRTDNFYRVRTGQLSRQTQGPWKVAAVLPFAAQHLKVAVDEAPHSREALTQFLRRDSAGAYSATIGQVTRGVSEAPLLKNTDRDRLAALLARHASVDCDYFRRLVRQATLPDAFRQELEQWSGDGRADANRLIDWALSKGSNPAEPNRSTLASILLPQLGRLGIEDSAIIVATISAYRLIHDEADLAALRVRYQSPVDLPGAGAGEALGPDFEWHGPKDSVELQSWLSAPPDYLEVGYLINAINSATSVCRVEVGATGERGTGVLVDGGFVLTNYHVVQSLIAGGKVASEASTVRIIFGSFSEVSETFETALDGGDPIVDWSPVEELDYALLRLAPDIAQAPNVRAAKRGSAVPAVRAAINILQHPEGGSMKLAPSENAVTFVDPQTGIIQYVTRTSRGSSGAPCFDSDWRLVAIHHAERSRAFGSIREGILIGPIWSRVERFMK